MIEGGLESWLQYLEGLHPSEMDLGLERVSAVGEALELLNPGVPVITVAGTNGKGSVVAVAEAMLLAAGKRTGAFTSPHFLKFNERISIDGQDAGVQTLDDLLVQATELGEVDLALGGQRLACP